ncbi:hypothetical protein CFC21_104592 [Triticum aestivum]|uniref:Dirigent protein n=2 Tax=Triticum aestivum TaxID=4565 RepID=A0A9R1N7M1_WHEAT|nr:uncharacterized protein LOC123155702 [Triticum aestivum]KAF7103618.1 hypothetical protein CFC21_104590 [Triticum aestivum]KAF7103620.1 hypothetical protein CFC21_104592 [Triticum aestivum]
MANFKVTSHSGALVENTKLDFQSLYLHRFISGDKKNQYVVIDGFGSTDLGLTTINNWAIYDGAASDAKLVAHAKGMRMNAADWCNLFIIVFELDRFKGSTLSVMGTTTEEQGEWAIVGGTGDFAMARGVIHRKIHQKVADGDVLELTIDAFCHRKGQPSPTPQPPAPCQPIQPPVQPRPAPTPIKYGPWGGTGEKLYQFNPNMSVRLKSMTVFRHYAVNRLTFTYTGQDGQEHTSELFGNSVLRGNKVDNQTFQLGPTEFLTGLSGTYGHESRSNNIAMYSLKLVTNLGNTHGPFGTPAIGTPFSFSVPQNNRIVSFFGGYTGYAINSIGIYTLDNSA